MSPVGHALMGIAFAQPVFRRASKHADKFAIVGCFISVAMLPDWPLPYWGHHRYEISHSLYVNLGLIVGVYALVMFLRASRNNTRLADWVCQAFGWLSLAWLSHLLLDSFYSHGQGVRIGWPVGEWRLIFPMPWFDIIHTNESIFSSHNMKVVFVELLFYSPIIVLMHLLSRRVNRSNR